MIKSNVDKRITLDAKHNEFLNQIKDEISNLPLLKENLKELIHEYTILKQIPKEDLSIEQFNYKFKLKNDIIQLKEKIKTIKNNDSLNEYYLKVGDLLYQYYDNIDNIANDDNNENNNDSNESSFNQVSKPTNNKQSKNNCVLDFFKPTNTIADEPIKESNYTNTKISDFVKTKSNFKRTHILNDYLKKVDDEYNSDILLDENVYKCPDCDNEEMILLSSEGIQICKKCGLQQSILIESDKPSFKDPPPEICYFSYKRINHFNEWLINFFHNKTLWFFKIKFIEIF
jgi:ribosomal protein S27E